MKSFFNTGDRISQNKAAMTDLIEGIRQWELWLFVAWHDIKQRYRTSTLGPLWITLSTAIMVGGMVVVYANLFKMEMKNYAPFLASGLILWGFISTIINESCTSFVDQAGVIKQIRKPLTLYICRIIFRNIIILAHNFLIILGISIFYKSISFVGVIEFIFTLFLASFAFLPLGLILGTVCARFRDIPIIVTSMLQLIFFVTPVVWQATSLSEKLHFIILWNPAYHLINILRSPLLGEGIPLDSLSIVCVLILLLFFAAYFLLTRARNRVAYWV